MNPKKIILELLKKLDIVGNNDTGQIIIHVNNGGITKVVKAIDVLK